MYYPASEIPSGDAQVSYQPNLRRCGHNYSLNTNQEQNTAMKSPGHSLRFSSIMYKV